MQTKTLLTVELELDSEIDAGPDTGTELGHMIPYELQLWLARGAPEDVDMRCHRLARYLEDLAIQLRHGIGPFTVIVGMAKDRRRATDQLAQPQVDEHGGI